MTPVTVGGLPKWLSLCESVSSPAGISGERRSLFQERPAIQVVGGIHSGTGFAAGDEHNGKEDQSDRL
jgi:hypothetical protein